MSHRALPKERVGVKPLSIALKRGTKGMLLAA
jgi:hypothetical protein